MNPRRGLSLVCAIAALAGCAASGSTAKKDVTIKECASSGGGHPTASGAIVNHSSKASLYTIHVKFMDTSGNSVGDGVAVISKVDPNTTAQWHANGTLAANGHITCKLNSVTRNATP